MNRQCTAANDMRSNRKRFSISGSLFPLLLLLVLLAAQTSGLPSSVNGSKKNDARPSGLDETEDGMADVAAFNAGDDYDDVDNVEWHHVKIVDGIMREDHPIIMYKEDFVSEDYDPSQHKSNSNESPSHARRRYKNQKRQHSNRTQQTEKYNALKPEKIYFDILPPTPVVVTDDSSSNDSKFDPSHIRVEVISLLDGVEDDADNKAQSSSIINDETQLPSKELLKKRPKKYLHHRLRRDTTGNNNHDAHTVHKRHPHYIYERVGSNSFDDYNKHLINYWGQKHAVPGNKWNGIDGDVPPAIDFGNRFGGEDNTDRVVWGISKVNRRPPTTRRPQMPKFPPLMHNSNPEDADFSPFTTRPSIQNDNRQPVTRRPQEPKLPPLFHNSNPEDADFSAFNIPPHTQQSQHHKKVHKLSLTSGPTSLRNPKTVNYENDRTEEDDVFDTNDTETAASLESKSKLVASENNAHCAKATNICCEMTELSMLYNCFNDSKCMRSIAQITSMCA